MKLLSCLLYWQSKLNDAVSFFFKDIKYRQTLTQTQIFSQDLEIFRVFISSVIRHSLPINCKKSCYNCELLLQNCDPNCVCEDSWNNTFSCIRSDRFLPKVYKYCVMKDNVVSKDKLNLRGSHIAKWLVCLFIMKEVLGWNLLKANQLVMLVA